MNLFLSIYKIPSVIVAFVLVIFILINQIFKAGLVETITNDRWMDGLRGQEKEFETIDRVINFSTWSAALIYVIINYNTFTQ